MNNYEALGALTEMLKANKAMCDNPLLFFTQKDYAEGVKNSRYRIEALELAIVALSTRDNIPGKWIESVNPETGKRSFKCSVCGIANGYMSNFCDVCGADMREDKNG